MTVADPAIAALDLMIADATTKYHQAMTGRLAVKIVVDGQETEFNKTSASDLMAYIGRLEARRAELLFGLPSSGAIGFVF